MTTTDSTPRTEPRAWALLDRQIRRLAARLAARSSSPPVAGAATRCASCGTVVEPPAGWPLSWTKCARHMDSGRPYESP